MTNHEATAQAAARCAARLKHPAFLSTLAKEADVEMVLEAVGLLHEYASVIRLVAGHQVEDGQSRSAPLN